jgi:3-dehydroquinate synthase
MGKMNTIPVSLGTRAYSIVVGQNILEDASAHLPFALNERKIFVLYDRAVEGHAKKLSSALGGNVHMKGVSGGEGAKSFTVLQEVLDWLLSHKVERTSVLFAVGGGVTGDLGGFAASIVLRGITLVQVPTTLLAQVDSSVGGKTGINAVQGKNLIGTFYQPAAVLCDTATLETLPIRERRAGFAEIVKYGLLGSAEFFAWLETAGQDILDLNAAALNDAIETSCRMKAEIVGEDEREEAGGARVLLNLGHTFAHALEAACGYDGRLLHGEAVGIGLVLAFRLSARLGLCSEQETRRVENHLKGLGLMTDIAEIMPKPSHGAEALYDLMAQDKKSSGGKIGFILCRGIGKAFQSRDVEKEDVLAVLRSSIKA